MASDQGLLIAGETCQDVNPYTADAWQLLPARWLSRRRSLAVSSAG